RGPTMESAVAPVVVRKPRRLMVEIMFVLPCGRSEPAPTIRSMIAKSFRRSRRCSDAPMRLAVRESPPLRWTRYRRGNRSRSSATSTTRIAGARAALTQPYASIHQLGARGPVDLGPERSLRRHSGGELRGRGAHRHHAELVEALAHIGQRQDAH